jgi:uncharacterized MAPEG superfamily protein
VVAGAKVTEFLKMLISAGGRKFFMTLGCGMATTALCASGNITGEVYAIVIVGTVGAYITGNVVQTVKGGNKA